ncbi:CRE-SDZ-1 protein [Caenorhabditis remanei]|uniref:CRE-SDZ-1 protein n=1 Tax=Caenorhabditis remanei TaxID=31234 RepID=E3N052_CAERE|nr:CRE-SDZ-1 protein [Caenorhabditis remanei]
MNTSVLFVFLCLIPLSQSAGFLNFKLTADRDCLLHLEHFSSEYSETVRLLAYETRSLHIYFPSINPPQISIDFQILHHFSGDSLSQVISQQFKLDNNGQWQSRVIDSDSVILSIQYTFYCENGYFGPICERRSRLVPIVTSTSTAITPFNHSITTQIKKVGVSDSTIVYLILAVFMFILVVFNCILCFCRPKKTSKYIDETPLEVYSIIETTRSTNVTNTTRYHDAPSRFLSSTTIECIV